MRAVIFICLLGTSFAAPQGYNYDQQNSFPVGVPQTGGFKQETNNFLQQAVPELTQNLLSGGQQQQQQQSSYIQRPFTSVLPQSFAISQEQPQLQQQFFQQNYNRPAPVVTKDIFVHVAPEEPEQQYLPPSAPIAPQRKHYRIVFIKTPIPKISTGALRLQQPQSEEKTIIYVLTKKPDPLDLQTAVQDAAPKPPSKPEVYFIKYKTKEEAQHAQRTIQAQYDKLGGTTQISDEGVAPITSVVGALDQVNSISGSNSEQSSGGAGFSSEGVSTSYGTSASTSSDSNTINIGNDNKYLPPIVRL